MDPLMNPVSDDNPFAYSMPIWQRFRAPGAVGRFEAQSEAVFTGEAGTPAAHSLLRLEFFVQNAQVVDARFQAYGCPASIAVGSWIAEWAPGRAVTEVLGLRAATLRRELEIPDDRAHCALMGEDAVKAALGKWRPT